MSKHILSDGRVATVTHVMADGSVRDSVEGYIKEFKDLPENAKDLINLWIDREFEEAVKEGRI